MSFMKPFVTDRQTWIEVDGHNGITYIPIELIGTLPEDAKDYELATLVSDYYEGGAKAVYSVMTTEGYGARMSAPGYMDCTEWSVFDTPEEAEAYLKEYYMDDEEAEDEDTE